MSIPDATEPRTDPKLRCDHIVRTLQGEMSSPLRADDFARVAREVYRGDELRRDDVLALLVSASAARKELDKLRVETFGPGSERVW